jgi:hypothetical protein
MWNPPYKDRLILKILSNILLGNFHWVTLLDVSETLPTRGPIFSLNTQVAANCGLPYLHVAPVLDVHIIRGDCMAVSLVANNTIHKAELIYLFIALLINVLDDDIRCVLITSAIGEISHIPPVIEHRTGVCIPGQGAVYFMLASIHLSCADLIVNWDIHRRANILLL